MRRTLLGKSAARLAVLTILISIVPCMAAAANKKSSTKPTAQPKADDTKLDDKKEIRLPEPFAQYCTGGKGRLLIFHLKKAQKLAVVDVAEAKIVTSIDAPGDDIRFAAGSDVLLIASNSERVLHRFSLKTFQREKSAPLPTAADVKIACMGNSSSGPLMLVSPEGACTMIDPATLKPIATEQGITLRVARGEDDVKVSADGQTFLAGAAVPVSGEVRVVRFSGGACTVSGGRTNNVGTSMIQPTADGSLLLENSQPARILTPDLKPVATSDLGDSILLASDDPAVFMALRAEDTPGKPRPRGGNHVVMVPTRLSICTTSDCRPFFALEHLESLVAAKARFEDGYFQGQPRAIFLTRDKLLATVPESNDVVYVRKFDVIEALKKSGQQRLIVTSKPRLTAEPGSAYTYPITVLSTAGGLKYRIESGPPGMTVSAAGLVSWQIPKTADGSVASVLVVLTDDAHKEAFHAFKIAIDKPRPAAAATVASGDKRHPAPAAAQPGPNKTAADKGPPVDTIALPRKFDEVCSGGGGRYLFFHTHGERELTIVDVVAGKVVRDITLPSEHPLVAAGRDKFFIVYPELNSVQRWSLTNFEREKSAPMNAANLPTFALMGNNGTGPLLLWPGDGLASLWDCDAMQVMAQEGPMIGNSVHWRRNVRVSADGRAFTNWTDQLSAQTYTVLEVKGNRTRVEGNPGTYDSGGWWVQPNADASLFFRDGGRIQYGDFKWITSETVKGRRLIPCTDPRFFFASSNTDLWICTAADCRPIYKFSGLERVPDLGGEPGVYYLPQNNLLATIADGRDKVYVRHFDLKKAIDEQGSDYLLVVSKPPLRAGVGGTYSYTLETWSKKGGVKYKLDEGPAGMTISPAGEVRWKVTQRPSDGVARASILVSDASGKELFHTLAILIRAPEPEAAAVAATSPKAAPPVAPANPLKSSPPASAPATAPPAVAAAPPRPSGGAGSHIVVPRAQYGGPLLTGVNDFVPRNADRIEIPAESFYWNPGLTYRSMLALCGDKLAILGPDGVTIRKQAQLPGSFSHIAEREDYFVAVGGEKAELDIIDKKSFKAIRRYMLKGTVCCDLALNPKRPVSYISIWHSPDYFIVFDEQKGEGLESPGFLATWLKIDPNGKHLLAGFEDTPRGDRGLVAPDPDEYVDDLISYPLWDTGVPGTSVMARRAGGNGVGISMSRDGKRISYLSHVGWPKFTGNLQGWDATRLGDPGVNYALKDRGTTKCLAYHPSLPLVASPGSGSAVFFDRETGEFQRDRLNVSANTFAGATVHAIQFSPDGKNLVFHISIGKVHYLQKVSLRLSDKELAKIDEELRTRPTTLAAGEPVRAKPTDPSHEKVPLKWLEALQGGIGQATTSKEIGRSFTNSVIVIQGDDMSGSGFCVGSEGYIVTCAHCVPRDGKITVSYRDADGKAVRTALAEPRVLAIDDSRDLALLKISPAHPMSPVCLFGGEKTESGERVVVIGNPGVGSAILDYTMTEGIVSNPDRDVLGQKYIQTSAQVNPGSSGGPMFDSNGQVIGVVVLKAKIEGAGFAIPAADVVRFLAGCASVRGSDTKLLRHWTDISGKQHVDAKFAGYAGYEPYGSNIVRLEKAYGKVIRIHIKKLSEADNRFLTIVKQKAAR